MYYVYVLKSQLDHGLYIGYTQDLDDRLREHNAGAVTSTQDRRPLDLVYYEAYTSEHDARRREGRLKQFKNSYKELTKRLTGSLQAKVVGGLIRTVTYVGR